MTEEWRTAAGTAWRERMADEMNLPVGDADRGLAFNIIEGWPYTCEQLAQIIADHCRNTRNDLRADDGLVERVIAAVMGNTEVVNGATLLYVRQAQEAILAALRTATPEPSDCPSCGGLNTSCPEGCGRDPVTGELNGTRLEPSDAVVEQIADSPGAGLISEEDGLRELGLLYNYAEDDSRQFTRWQMLIAMSHGFGLAREIAALRTATPDAVVEAEQVLKLFNGGLIDVPDETNARGFTTHYMPLEAMKNALAALRSRADGDALEVTRLREALEKIASKPPRPESYGDEKPLRCQVCQYRGHVEGEERHSDDCPYILARAALAPASTDGEGA